MASTPSFDSLLATTLKNTSSEMVDNAAQSIPLIYKLKQSQNIKLDGGTEIERAIRYNKNTTYSRISGYEPFDITPSNPFTTCNWDYKQMVISVSTSDKEKWSNAGKEKLIDLVAEKKADAQDALECGLDEDCYSNGSLPNQIGGLQLLVPLDPTASSVVGGINQATYEFWQSVVKTATGLGGALSTSNILNYIRQLKQATTRNGKGCDMALLGNTEINILAAALEANGRYAGDKDSISAGFESIKYFGIDFMNAEEADGNLPSTYNYFLDSKTLLLVIHKDRNFVPLEGDRTLNTQAASVHPITFVGNLICTCRRNQALFVNA